MIITFFGETRLRCKHSKWNSGLELRFDERQGADFVSYKFRTVGVTEAPAFP
jgi:hypothetical protein